MPADANIGQTNVAGGLDAILINVEMVGFHLALEVNL